MCENKVRAWRDLEHNPSLSIFQANPSKQLPRKMTASAASLAAELMAEFAAAQSKGLNLKTCEHCGITCAGGEVHCDCTELITKYGTCGCASCAIDYGTPYMHILEYIDFWNEYGDGEETAKAFYAKDLLAKMPKPCEECSEAYKVEHKYLWDEYTIWLNSYNTRIWREIRSTYDDRWYDQRCSGGICSCCGRTRD